MFGRVMRLGARARDPRARPPMSLDADEDFSNSAAELFPAQEAVVGHFVVIALAAEVDVRLRRKPGRHIEGARTDPHLRRSIFVPQQTRPTLAAEPSPHCGRLRVPLETALLGESKPGTVDGRI